MQQLPQTRKKYDLEDRTFNFGKSVIELCAQLRSTPILAPIINQLIRSSTSIGANYMEANGASSRKDFANKIYICKKESQETKYWLRMLGSLNIDSINKKVRNLWAEAQELTLIFQKITSTIKKKAQNSMKIEN